MRLTLRTLLAYRDGVLSSAETSDLHQRIKQTEVANNLMRRIELLMEQKQMLAPKVIGTGLGADANSVAEYLDDTLASDQVAEFERICIAESDLVLTELAHCHQLLADALNSKVHVPASLKSLAAGLSNPENQAALASRIRPPRKVDKNADSTTSFVTADGTQRRTDAAHSNNLVPAQVVSDEIKERQEPRAAVTDAKPETVLKNSASDAKSLVTAPIDVMNSQVNKPLANSQVSPTKPSHQVPDYLVTPNSGGWKIPLAILAVLGLFIVLAIQALGPLTNIQNLFVANNAATQNEKPVVTDVSKPVEPSPIKANENANARDAVKRLQPESDANQASPELNEKEADKTDSELNTIPEPKQPVAPETDAAALDSEKANESNAVPALSDTRSVSWKPTTDAESRSVVFLRPLNGEPRSFTRLTPASSVGNEIELVIPPAMRPKLNIADVCTWTACGPSKIVPSATENGGVLIKTSLCRAIVKANAADRNLSLAAPAGSVDLAFNEATSGASIEVAYRTASSGPITDRNAFKPILIVVAVEGEVSVTPNLDSSEGATKKPIRLNVGEGVALIDGQANEFELGSIPTWYRANADRQIDLLAAEDMHQLLYQGSNIEAQLSAMHTERRPETSALAIQSSAMLGDWSGFANNLLNDEMMRTHWASTIGLAEQLLADDPTQIESLSHELEGVFGELSGTLTTLLIGSNAAPSSGDNQKSVHQELVDSLTSEQLPVRVLAAHQLFKLTGKDFGFQPATPNRTAVQQWRRELATNKMGSVLNPNVLWEAKRSENGR